MPREVSREAPPEATHLTRPNVLSSRSAPPPAAAASSEPRAKSQPEKHSEHSLDHAEAPEHVRQNIEAIVALEARAEHAMTRHQRFIETLTSFVGRPRFLYAVVVFGALWIAGNAVVPRRLAFDPPPFDLLQLVFTAAGVLVAIMVLITQNRQSRISDQRGHLDLQVNLLSEQKVTKLIEMLDAIQRDVPRTSKLDPMTEAMKASVDPHAVVDALEMVVEEPHDE